MKNPVLSVRSVSSGYAKYNVVEDISFDIQAGEVFGLIGLNGVGKTTLIKTILELRQKTAGEILIDRSDVAYLPERFEPPWFLSGYDFIKFSMRLYKKQCSFDDVQEAACSISLNPDVLKKNVATYSKGMRQKLGLLSTILTGCQLLILDEPMSGLDPKARQEVKVLILEAKEKGRSILMCSHILSDVSELCDKVAVIHDLSVLFQGTPAELQKKGGDVNLEKAFLSLLAA